MAADYFSSQLTSIDAGAIQPATIGIYKFGPKDRPVYRGSFSTGSVISGKTIEMVRLPVGVIPWRVSLLIDTTTGSSTLAVGSSVTAAKYRAAATLTTINQWFSYMILPLAALTVEELVWITIGSATMPATYNLELAVEAIVP